MHNFMAGRQMADIGYYLHRLCDSNR